LRDPPPNEGNGVVRAANIDRLAVATEPKHRVACSALTSPNMPLVNGRIVAYVFGIC
jgi:hypothetical protein